MNVQLNVFMNYDSELLAFFLLLNSLFLWIGFVLSLHVFISIWFLACFRCEMGNNEQESQDSCELKTFSFERSHRRDEKTGKRTVIRPKRIQKNVYTTQDSPVKKTELYSQSWLLSSSHCALSSVRHVRSVV